MTRNEEEAEDKKKKEWEIYSHETKIGEKKSGEDEGTEGEDKGSSSWKWLLTFPLSVLKPKSNYCQAGIAFLHINSLLWIKLMSLTNSLSS